MPTVSQTEMWVYTDCGFSPELAPPSNTQLPFGRVTLCNTVAPAASGASAGAAQCCVPGGGVLRKGSFASLLARLTQPVRQHATHVDDS
jgi:hypothetical protein